MIDCISNSPADLLANNILKEGAKGFWLLYAASGAGKTTVCQAVLERVSQRGVSVGGILCPAVYESGIKVSIDQVDIRTGERRQLGVRVKVTGESTVGCWQLDETVLAWGNEIIADLKDEDLIVIDELGPLELEEGYGYQEGIRLLDERRYRSALVVVRPTLLALARYRWPQACVVGFESEQA